MSILRRLFGKEEGKATSRPLRLQNREFGLRRNDPPGTYDNTLKADLVFRGRILIEVEDYWNDERTKNTYIDGEVINRLAIYEMTNGGDATAFVGQQLRSNPRVLMITPKVRDSGGLPLMSLSMEFKTFSATVDWISAGSVIQEGHLRGLFESELERHEAGLEPASVPRTFSGHLL